MNDAVRAVLLLTSFGVAAPATSTAPITKSALSTRFSTACGVENAVCTEEPK